MPKLHFGSRGGVYTIKKGTKKYLKFGNYEIDSNDFDFGDEGDEGELGYYANRMESNRMELDKLINEIDNNNNTKDIIKLFSMLGYSEPGGNKLPSNYKNRVNINLENNLGYLIGYDSDFDYYFGLINSIIDNLPPTIEYGNPKRI
jgi:hypothetical protein